MKKVLAIDYGTTRVGLAISRGSLAEPLMIVGSEKAISKIDQIVKDEQIELFVIGMSENRMAERIQEFATALSKATGLDYVFVDETLSSKEVRAKLRSAPVKASKKHGFIDHFVAAELLQNWLDEQ